ncbi:hypothetical protein [Ahrensia sp. 13_GOM-1096m]|uniref:hypothetical protein n=1 Tax=Ahrensia sp. 13_GOM-1096m TaxID=1380380 RepID=UPI000478C6DC|nr:hypothetical protein [Ahrensia sp. 13_GOM-1096m]
MSPATHNDNAAQASLFAVKPSERQLKPFPVSEWLAMSALQKAIRRNEPEIALRAAVTLLELKPDRLWRRLAGTCFEDIGHGDF